ncbi:MAG: lamin tail domain-containing protein, partial [Microgenomates group bacterium]
MIWKIMYWLVAIALFVVLAVDHAQAAVIISEVAPAPITGPEWVELYNTGPEMINFNSWYLEDKLASPARIYDFVFDSTIPNKWQFPPYTFLVLSLSSAKLNNSGDGVTLYNPDHQMSATMNYANTNAGKTWGLQALDFTKYIESDPNPNQFTPTPPSSSPSPLPSSSPSPTPTIPFPSPSPSSNTLDTALVSLHTYHPCPPSGEKEWLSLLYSGQKIHTFENWVIADESGNTRTLSGTLVPKETTKLEWSGALLNNTGDSFTLHSDDSKLI